MTKPRVTTADRLSNIIEVVELGRRSGLLTVERGSNETFEQGEVYFAQGRAIYAMVEGLRGRDALAVLAGWGHCRFAFEPNAPSPQPNVTQPQQHPSAPSRPAPQHGDGTGYFAPQRSQPTPPRSAPSSFNWSTPGSRPMPDPQTPASYTGPIPSPQANSTAGALDGSPMSPMPPSIPSTPSSFGASWPANLSSSTPGATRHTSGQLSWSASNSALSPTPSQSTGPINPQLLQRRPRRAPDVRDLISVVNTYNLSRNHRTILLLADGEHTVLDLARLSSKQVDEIMALLADLERLGLVYYY
jgi:hypothetical protein